MAPKLKLRSMIADLKQMRNSLLAEAERESIASAGGGDFEFQKLQLVKSLADIRKEIEHLTELRARSTDVRDVPAIRIYVSNVAALKKAQAAWKALQQLAFTEMKNLPKPVVNVVVAIPVTGAATATAAAAANTTGDGATTAAVPNTTAGSGSDSEDDSKADSKPVLRQKQLNLLAAEIRSLMTANAYPCGGPAGAAAASAIDPTNRTAIVSSHKKRVIKTKNRRPRRASSRDRRGSASGSESDSDADAATAATATGEGATGAVSGNDSFAGLVVVSDVKQPASASAAAAKSGDSKLDNKHSDVSINSVAAAAGDSDVQLWMAQADASRLEQDAMLSDILTGLNELNQLAIDLGVAIDQSRAAVNELGDRLERTSAGMAKSNKRVTQIIAEA